MAARVDYRKLAFANYEPFYAHCGFGISAVLEVAHVDGNRQNNDVFNLVILCPNCHKMLDLDLISNDTIVTMRDRPKVVRWSKRMKDAGKKAAVKRKRTLAARKAAATRRSNQQIEKGPALEFMTNASSKPDENNTVQKAKSSGSSAPGRSGR